MNVIEKKFPRVLVISHNTFSLILNNGKTLTTLFRGWPQPNLAQLYFQPGTPDRTVCDNFFYLSSVDVLKALLGKPSGGRIVEKVDGTTLVVPGRAGLVRRLVKKVRWQGGDYLRDLLWSTDRWNHNLLANWLDAFCPEVVMLVGSPFSFPMNVARWICTRHKIPLVVFYTDDYLTRPSGGLSKQFLFASRMRAFHKAHHLIDSFFVASDKMAAEYEARFGIPGTLVMNCVDLDSYRRSGVAKSQPVTLAYFGGLHLKRWETLAFIGQCLLELRQEEGIEAELHVYSQTELTPEMIKALDIPPVLSFCGGLDQKQVLAKILETSILVHVESFESVQRRFTRLSLSTKIPEYLASGNAILAVGPAEIASMEYLQRPAPMAMVVTELSKDFMKNALRDLITHPEKRELLGQNARIWAAEHNDCARISQQVRTILSKAAEPQISDRS